MELALASRSRRASHLQMRKKFVITCISVANKTNKLTSGLFSPFLLVKILKGWPIYFNLPKVERKK